MAKQQSSRPFAGIIGMLIGVAILYFIITMVLGTVTLFWKILSFLGPFLFVLAMIFDFSTVKNHGIMLLDKLRNDTPKGLMYTVGSVVGFPFLSLYLFLKAFASRKLRKTSEKTAKNKKSDEDYIKYEEVEDDDFLELPDLDEEVPEQKPLNRYDDLFSE